LSSVFPHTQKDWAYTGSECPISQNVSRETFSTIHNYVTLLLAWNKKIALISRRMTEEDIYLHISDALNIAKQLHHTNAILEVGSGNGILGISLAIILNDKKYFLIERNKKKCAFLQEMKCALSLPIHIHNTDVKLALIEGIDCIISKAVGDLLTTLNLCEHLVKPDLFILLCKNIDQIEKEIREAKKVWSFLQDVEVSDDSSKRCILKVYNICKINSARP